MKSILNNLKWRTWILKRRTAIEIRNPKEKEKLVRSRRKLVNRVENCIWLLMCQSLAQKNFMENNHFIIYSINYQLNPQTTMLSISVLLVSTRTKVIYKYAWERIINNKMSKLLYFSLQNLQNSKIASFFSGFPKAFSPSLNHNLTLNISPSVSRKYFNSIIIYSTVCNLKV